jgi:hypothetical protein
MLIKKLNKIAYAVNKTSPHKFDSSIIDIDFFYINLTNIKSHYYCYYLTSFKNKIYNMFNYKYVVNTDDLLSNSNSYLKDYIKEYVKNEIK